MPQKHEYPKYLQRTESELAEEAKVQELRRASFSRAHKTPEEAFIGTGALLEQTARGNLDAAKDDPEAIEFHKAQLAQGLALQGRYTEAIEQHPDPEMKASYQAIADAIELDDGEKCGCGDLAGQQDGVDIAITPRFSRQLVFSLKHKKVVDLIECQSCEHKNARPARSRLLLSAAKQNRPSGTGRGLIRDVELLKSGSTITTRS